MAVCQFHLRIGVFSFTVGRHVSRMTKPSREAGVPRRSSVNGMKSARL